MQDSSWGRFYCGMERGILARAPGHLNWMTLANRPRQLRDEDKSCGTQPAYIRVIYRRLLLLMSCLIAVCFYKESAGPPKAREGFSGPADKLYLYIGVAMS